MVTPGSAAAWDHAARRGATLPGRRVRQTGAPAASRPPARPQHPDRWGDCRAGGGLGRQPAQGGGAGSGRPSGGEPRGAAGDSGVEGWGGAHHQESPAAPRRAGEGPPLCSSEITPGPPRRPTAGPGQLWRGASRAEPGSDGDPPSPPGLRAPALPAPTPHPPSDSPREYRDLGDSRSRSALSNEMKSEGIAARPSPARGQREGGSGGGGGTSSPGPRAPNRGRRGEGGSRCLLLLLLLEGSHFPPGRATRRAAWWRAAALRSRDLTPGESRERRRFGRRRGEGESQRVRFGLLLRAH